MEDEKPREGQLLLNGKVLVAGGQTLIEPYTVAELYDPSTNISSATGSLIESRISHTATLLTNGHVLVVGGSGPSGGNDIVPGGAMASAELYYW